MPVQILSDAEREAWSRFPEGIDETALGAFFTLSAVRPGVSGGCVVMRTGSPAIRARRLKGTEAWLA